MTEKELGELPASELFSRMNAAVKAKKMTLTETKKWWDRWEQLRYPGRNKDEHDLISEVDKLFGLEEENE